MMTRTQIDAPVAGEESPDASTTLETGDIIATSLEKAANKCIKVGCIAAVVVVVSIKALDILFGQLLSH